MADAANVFWSRSSGNRTAARVVTEKFNDFRNHARCGFVNATLPVLHRIPIDTQKASHIGLEKMPLEPATFKMLSKRLWILDGGLG